MPLINTMESLHETLMFFFFHPFSLICLLLFLIFTYKWRSPNSNTKNTTPPSPPRLPIIGNLHQLGTHPYRTLQTLSRKYGDLMFLRFGSKPAIVVSSAELASQVLKTHDLIFANRPQLSVLRRLLGNGKDVLLSPYAENWRRLRGICVNHLLSVKRVRSFCRVREEEVALMTKKIHGLSMVNLSEMFVSLSTDVICRVAFGKKYAGESFGIDFKMLLDELTKLLGCYYIGDFVSWLGWIDRINGVDAMVNKVTSGFDAFFERIIEEHSLEQRSKTDGDDQENEMIMTNFVDVLLEAPGEDSGSGNFCLDKETIKALILDMFAAGSDTAYITQEWIMSELLRNPRVMKELQKEVRGIAGNKVAVTEDDLENMRYLKAVIKETLRLHPPAPLMPPHESTEAVKINGYDIASGTIVIINIWSISRDPAYWEEPENFFPERFLNSPIDFKGQDFQLIPFGSGRRMCPGMAFAIAITELVVANLVYQFDWALPDGVDGESLDMTEVPGLAVHRKTPLLAKPTPRID